MAQIGAHGLQTAHVISELQGVHPAECGAQHCSDGRRQCCSLCGGGGAPRGSVAGSREIQQEDTLRCRCVALAPHLAIVLPRIKPRLGHTMLDGIQSIWKQLTNPTWPRCAVDSPFRHHSLTDTRLVPQKAPSMSSDSPVSLLAWHPCQRLSATAAGAIRHCTFTLEQLIRVSGPAHRSSSMG